MAAGDLYIECEGGGKKLVASSSTLEMLNALLVKTTGGKYGFRAVTSSAAANAISPVVPCGGPNLDLDQILAYAIVESASGEPAIGFVTES